MNTEQQNHEQLRRLLKLKRHEQPHPRYFNTFSSEVLKRIEAGENGDATLNTLERLWEYFSARPAWTGAFAATACALLVASVLYAEYDQRLDANTLAGDQPSLAGGAFVNNDSAMSLFSTNPVATGNPTMVQPGQSLFNQMPLGQQPPVIRVSYPVGGN